MCARARACMCNSVVIYILIPSWGSLHTPYRKQFSHRRPPAATATSSQCWVAQESYGGGQLMRTLWSSHRHSLWEIFCQCWKWWNMSSSKCSPKLVFSETLSALQVVLGIASRTNKPCLLHCSLNILTPPSMFTSTHAPRNACYCMIQRVTVYSGKCFSSWWPKVFLSEKPPGLVFSLINTYTYYIICYLQQKVT